MDRFFLPKAQFTSMPSLTDEEAHHCMRVMRKRVGDRILIFDGEGRWAEAIIRSGGRNEVSLDIVREKPIQKKPIAVELAVGVPKGKTMDLLIQKAVELGVTRIIPLLTDQGNVQISEKEGGKKREKWQRVALEACKQCGQNWLPVVELPTSLASYLSEDHSKKATLLAALLPESVPLRERFPKILPERGFAFLVGPEGDFSPREYAAALEVGFSPITLGDLVLKVETAGMFLLSTVRLAFSEQP